VWKKLNSLKDIESMTNTDSSCFNSNIDIVSEMISSFTSMIDFLEMGKMRMSLQNSINYRIKSGKRIIFILFLHQIKTDEITPVVLTCQSEYFFEVLISEHFESHKYESKRKVRINFCQIFNNDIQ